jgi:hypothetical protein
MREQESISMFKPYSTRMNERSRKASGVLLRYDEIPVSLRVQAMRILERVIGNYGPRGISYSSAEVAPHDVWRAIAREVTESAGIEDFTARARAPKERFQEYLTNDALSLDRIIDALEISFNLIGQLGHLPDWYHREYSPQITFAEAVTQLNQRFLEHGLGYQFVDDRIVVMSHEYPHQHIVEPAFELLHGDGFGGAKKEFAEAHNHFSNGRTREAIAGAQNALESTIKSILDLKGYPYPANATASSLVDFAIAAEIIPKELESHYKGLISAMKSGLPVIGNKVARHGQGATPIEIPSYLAAHCLHLAAANIIFLVEAWRSSDPN